ncbi:MAG: DUF1559 domain-containing protein, partial [Planctomycetia bacterium]|nr:DUF1559 domain-containing protein [Planctomycetia bacterium]
MRKRFFVRNKLLLLSLFALFLIAAGIWDFYRTIPLRISPETTGITEPRTPDGKRIDFVRYEQSFFPEGARTSENGFRVFLEEGGGKFLFRQPDEKFPDEVYSAAKLLDLEEVRKFPFEYQPTVLFANRKGGKFKSNYTKESWRQLEEVSRLNDPILDMFQKAVRKDLFYIPPGYPGLSLSLCNSLLIRAYLRVDRGDFDGAIDDITTIFRFVRHLARFSDFPLEEAGSLAYLESIAAEIDLDSNPDRKPTKEQWIRFQKENEKIPLHYDEKTCEKLSVRSFLKILDLASQPGKTGQYGHKKLSQILYKSFELGIPKPGYDLNIAARCLTGKDPIDLNDPLLDRIGYTDTSLNLFPMIGVRDRLFLLSRKTRSRLLAEQYLKLRKEIGADQEAVLESECFRNYRAILCAMQIYKADHGTFPPAFTVDSKGRPLQSWRVLLLPYLGYKDLYDQIRKEEPWDSPYNRAFHQRDLAVYRCPVLQCEKIRSKQAYKIPAL